MEKIINYISRGQGLGLKFLLLFSLIVAVFYAVGTKFAGDQFFVPAAQKAADAFLPIRIENGIVTEPEIRSRTTPSFSAKEKFRMRKVST